MSLVNIGLSIAGIVLANYGIKLGRAYPLIKKAFISAENERKARKDGILTEKEKAGLYDNHTATIKEAWSIIKGLTPFKSKD